MSISVDTILAALKAAIPLAKSLAALTATLWDNRAVAFVEALASNPVLIEWLRKLLQEPAIVSTSGAARTEAIVARAELCSTPEVKEAVAALGFDWLTVIATYLPLGVRLLLTILGFRG